MTPGGFSMPAGQRHGLAELMFLRSTPGRMGNLLIPVTAPRNQSVCEGS